MTTAANIREFLITRRSRLSPADAGLPDFGGRRRVPGLRREEVALLAGMSVEYYVRLERGNASGISDAILDGISRALKLDDAEHAHLYDLARAANQGARTPRRKPASRTQQIRAGTQRLLDAMTFPAIIQNGRMDVVATNTLGRALFSEMYVHPQEPVNFARFLFLDPRGRATYRDWNDSAEQIVALLRAESGRVPADRALRGLIGELADGSSEFAALWEAHDVRVHLAGIKLIHHPDVGDLDLSYEAMQLITDPGLQFIGFTAEPGSASDHALRLLGSLAARAPEEIKLER
ncbi:helix-turn-helix transcriptional regulator [Arthrobacter oryzae]|uniref:helix-turn-helix domain-containing protein n=1 Tax=Arthrobacter oryzae TaxID=409290 RepID=UPI0028614997|nr:helix-turn-helix transcriptional regulator [Arthrobacter oryzae]MDR6508368.1 transcriptional regulator with XRE-family HTH domain [Arthrobacter oryzae]